MYYLSEENRADGPTRKRPPDPPDVELPTWFQQLLEGDHHGFDQWICGLGPDFSLHPFNFEDLMNGEKTDLRPHSHMAGKERRRTSCKKLNMAQKLSTLSSTTAGVLHASASKAGSVSSESAAAPGNTETPLTAEVSEAPEEDDVLPTSTTTHFLNSKEPEPEFYELLKAFPVSQFVFKGDSPDLTVPGGLDLFSGCGGVARSMADNGAPWVLTFDWCRSTKEDLLNEELRDKLRLLLRLGAFATLGMAPICASFSSAVTPPVRSNRYLRGLPNLSFNMKRKVSEGNSHSDFCIELIGIAKLVGVAYFLENPDGSWLWKQKKYSEYADPSSPHTFRLCFCRFGTQWRKATRIATSTRLRSLRMMCRCKKKHFALRGFSSIHRKMWTKVAEPYPAGLARLLAISLCCQAGWCEQKKLNVAGCSRCRTLRCGEAANPGPRRGYHADRGTLEDMPLLSGHTQALEAKQLGLFVEWCKRTIRSIPIDELFDKVPSYAGFCLRAYGDILFQHGGALSNFRHCILALQRWKPLCRPHMFGPWELVRRWEVQEPVSHRPPLPEGIVKGLVALWLVWGHPYCFLWCWPLGRNPTLSSKWPHPTLWHCGRGCRQCLPWTSQVQKPEQTASKNPAHEGLQQVLREAVNQDLCQLWWRWDGRSVSTSVGLSAENLWHWQIIAVNTWGASWGLGCLGLSQWSSHHADPMEPSSPSARNVGIVHPRNCIPHCFQQLIYLYKI